MSKSTSPPRVGTRHSDGQTRPRSAAGLEVGPVLTLPGLPELDTSYEDQARKMASRYQVIIAKVEQIVRAKMSRLPRSYRYHCLEHTEQVVRNVLAIAAAERLPEAELPLLIIAAWLHDFMIDEIYVGHEAAVSEFAASLFSPSSAMGGVHDRSCTLTAGELEIIQSSIMATKLPQQAPHQFAEILADADLLYLGTNLFFPWSTRLREEHAEVLGRAYSDLEWIELNIGFLREHKYFTAFASAYCERGIAQNLYALFAMRDLQN